MLLSVRLALRARNDFLAANPKSPLVPNALYWLGETYYVTREFDRALSTFSTLVTDFPQSSKVPDARLKARIPVSLCAAPGVSPRSCAK